MNKLNWEKFLNFWSQFYDDSQDIDKKLYYPYIDDKGLLKGGSLKNLWRWKMQVHFKNENSQRALMLMEKDKKTILNYRKSNPSFNTLYNFSKKIFKNGIVYSIFLMHICRPEEYPIFDQHVFRSFVFITKKEIVDKPEKIEDYLKYRKFVLFVHKKHKIDLRKIDKGLMAFGQFLVNPSKILKY